MRGNSPWVLHEIRISPSRNLISGRLVPAPESDEQPRLDGETTLWMNQEPAVFKSHNIEIRVKDKVPQRGTASWWHIAHLAETSFHGHI